MFNLATQNNALQNGSTLGTTQIGTQNAVMAPLGTTTPTASGVTGVDVTATGSPQIGGWFKNQDGSLNSQNLGLAMGGVQMLGNLWNSFQQHKIAKESLGLARETFQTNLENNSQTYNTALEDRIRARHHTEGRDTSETDAYLSKHSL